MQTGPSWAVLLLHISPALHSAKLGGTRKFQMVPCSSVGCMCVCLLHMISLSGKMAWGSLQHGNCDPRRVNMQSYTKPPPESHLLMCHRPWPMWQESTQGYEYQKAQFFGCHQHSSLPVLLTRALRPGDTFALEEAGAAQRFNKKPCGPTNLERIH